MSSNDHTKPRFHRGLTFFLALMLTMSICVVGAGMSLRGALAFDAPAQTAREHFERGIAFEKAIAEEPQWLARPLLLFLGRVEGALPQAIDAYEALVESQVSALAEPGTEPASKETAGAPAPPSGLGCAPTPPILPPKDTRADLCELVARRAILQGEIGRFDDLLLSVARLDGLGERATARAVRAAYEGDVTRHAEELRAYDFTRLHPGWARDRFEQRLCRQLGKMERATALENADRAARATILGRARLLAWSVLVLSALGLAALLLWLFRDRPELPRSSATLPPEWNFEDGLAVLLRGLALGIAVLAIVELTVHQYAPDWFLAAGTLLLPVPFLMLFRRGILVPRGFSSSRVLGLDAFPGGPAKWLAIVLGLFAADQLGQALILELCGRIGAIRPWSESVNESLLRSPTLAFSITWICLVAWAPITNEILCRGLLYSTLRVRMPIVSAALWSSAVVAAFQNLSAPAFLMTLWSGFLCAVVFERTRSILPAVASQILATALYLGAFGWFFR